jgi:signal transduction histidine kinase
MKSDVMNDLLQVQPMPNLAAALRQQKDRILARWNHMVRELLPDADHLTMEEVRDSIPIILDQMATALAADEPTPTDRLLELTKLHGADRFRESFSMHELIAEYRILRRVIAEEIDGVLGKLTAKEWMGLDIAVDIALQQAVVTYLEHLEAKVKAATAAESEFWTFLAHDLRGSLNAILMTGQWLETSLSAYPELTEQKEELRRCRESIVETIASMEQLLQSQRFRRREIKAKLESVPLEPLVHEIVAYFHRAAQAKGLVIEASVPKGVVVSTDRGFLRLILQNLLGNAIKYSDHGIIRLDVNERDGEKGWVLRVSDKGKGILPELLPALFDPFTRGRAQVTDGQSGVGLGLFIASQAAKSIGATITVESKVNVGSTFSIMFPF